MSAPSHAVHAILNSPLPRNVVSSRPGPRGAQLVYLTGAVTVELANRIFGNGGWDSDIMKVEDVSIEKLENGKISVTSSAVVCVKWIGHNAHTDIGHGTAVCDTTGAAIEAAQKAAVTDARKRALRLFGTALGNAVNDPQAAERAQSAVRSLGALVAPAPPPAAHIPSSAHLVTPPRAGASAVHASCARLLDDEFDPADLAAAVDAVVREKRLGGSDGAPPPKHVRRTTASGELRVMPW